jgi:serine O-acetyltransferase
MIQSIKNNGLLGNILPLAGNKLAVLLYRISNGLYKLKIPEIPYIFQYLNAIINGCEIHYRTKIGKKFKISHSRAIVIGREVVIGDYVTIRSSVVMGQNTKNGGMPKIGNNVVIGAGAVLVGNITIGDNSIIGANAFVNRDFESNSLIGGIPAKLIKKLGNDKIND